MFYLGMLFGFFGGVMLATCCITQGPNTFTLYRPIWLDGRRELPSARNQTLAARTPWGRESRDDCATIVDRLEV